MLNLEKRCLRCIVHYLLGFSPGDLLQLKLNEQLLTSRYKFSFIKQVKRSVPFGIYNKIVQEILHNYDMFVTIELLKELVNSSVQNLYLTNSMHFDVALENDEHILGPTILHNKLLEFEYDGLNMNCNDCLLKLEMSNMLSMNANLTCLKINDVDNFDIVKVRSIND